MTSEGTPPRTGEAIRAAEASAPGDARRELLRRRLRAAGRGARRQSDHAANGVDAGRAVLRPATALVPPPARRREPVLHRELGDAPPTADRSRRPRASLNEIVARHEVLRTTFHEVDGRRSRRSSPSVHVALAGRRSLRARRRRLAPARRRRLAVESSRHAFDLTTGPLLRAALLRLGPSRLGLAARHPPHRLRRLVDVGVLPRAVGDLRRVRGRAPEPAAAAADPVRRLRGAGSGMRWPSRLESRSGTGASSSPTCPPWSCPTDRPRPATFSYAARRSRFDVPPVVASALQRLLAAASGATLFMTLLAGFAVAAAPLRQPGRRRRGLPDRQPDPPRARGPDRLLRQHARAARRHRRAADVRELLDRVRRTALEAFDHQDVPFEKLVDELPPGPRPQPQPAVPGDLPAPLVRRRRGPSAARRRSPSSTSRRSIAKFDLRLDFVDGRRRPARHRRVQHGPVRPATGSSGWSSHLLGVAGGDGPPTRRVAHRRRRRS